MDFVEMDLGFADAVNPSLLTPFEKKIYGGEKAESEIKEGKIRVRLGERPTARNLKTLLKNSGQELPAGLSVYKEYNIWLISFGVGVVKEGGWRNVTQLGLQVELPISPRFTVLGLLPDTRFIKRISVGFQCDAQVQANGSIKTPDLNVSIHGVDASTGASAGAKVGGNLGWNLSFTALTATATAIGKGDRRAEWSIEADEHPLIGDQELVATVLTPLVADGIKVKARVNATTTVFDFLPVLLKGREVELDVPLS